MQDIDPDEYLVGWTIYRHPSDFPHHFVVRMWFVPEPGVVALQLFSCLCDSLDEAREQIPSGTMRFPREVGDDIVIVETYI